MSLPFTWHQLDYVADAYNPLLLLTTLVLIVRAFVHHKKSKGSRLLVLLILGLLSVYALKWTDERYLLWASLRLDYSTHTAFSICMVWIIHRAIANKRALLFLLWTSLMGYFALVIYQRYHSIADISSTALVFVVIMTLIDLVLAKRILWLTR